jgi:outer membrane protein TolC
MNKSRSLFTTLAVAAAILAPLVAQAQEVSSAEGTAAVPARTLLDRRVRKALAANLALAQQTAATQRAAAVVREANGRFLPSAGFNARYSEFSGVVNIGDFINPAYAALTSVGKRD